MLIGKSFVKKDLE
jgi:hypothetical protein